MKLPKFIKPLSGVLCIFVLAAVVMLALYLDSLSPDPIFGVFHPEPTRDGHTTTTQSATQGEGSSTTVEGGSSAALSTTVEGSSSTAQTTTQRADGTTCATTTDGATTITKTGEDTATTPSTRPQEEPVTPPADLPPVVEIPTEKDPETGETELTFPCQVPGYELVIQRLAPYSGMFVEDGTNATVENVAMLLLSNKGDHPVEYAQIAVRYGEETLLFDVSALPAGEQLVVQEKNGKSIPNGKAEAATAMVVRKADLEMSRDKIEVIDNGNNTLTIRNLTDQMIPTVRVFYKYYMEDEDVFVGGIAFTVRIIRLDAQGAVTIQPSHYSSQTGRVVMVLTYDSEV